MKKIVKISEYIDEDSGETRRGLVVDGELFDWSMGLGKETSALYMQLKMNKDPNFRKILKGETIKQFMSNLSEFLGRKVTIQEINEAIEKGEMEC